MNAFYCSFNRLVALVVWINQHSVILLFSKWDSVRCGITHQLVIIMIVQIQKKKKKTILCNMSKVVGTSCISLAFVLMAMPSAFLDGKYQSNAETLRFITIVKQL